MNRRLGMRPAGRPARPGRRVRRPAVGTLLLGTLLLTAACTGSEPAGQRSGTADQGGTPTTFADCATLTTPPPTTAGAATAPPTTAGAATPPPITAGAATAPSTTAGAATAPANAPSGTGTGETATPGGAGSTVPPGGLVRSLPTFSLPCLVGDSTVEVGALRGPAVINLWASWCPPCLKELPAFQRLADHADGAVRVIGVNTGDDRDAARSLGADFGLRFPSLFDRDKRLLRHAKRPLVPVTFFVDVDGRIRHEDQTGALEYPELVQLVRDHLGVTVRP